MKTTGSAFWHSILLVIGLPALVAAGEAQNAFNEGVKLYRAGKFKEAIAAYDRAVKAAPEAA
jgi:tetratricopeptide (TPR) repeat protein